MKFNQAFRIITNGGLGDALLVTPSIKSIKENFPNLNIVIYCTKKEHVDIFSNNPNISKVVYLKSMSIQRYIDMLRYKFRLISIHRVDWGSLHPSLFYTIPAVEIIADMLRIKLSSNKMEVFFTEQEKIRAKTFMSGFKNPILINPSGKCTLNKEWYIERWEKVIEHFPEYTFIQIGLNEEQYIKGTIDIRGKKNLRDCMALFEYALGFVGVESFWGHLTAAVKIPGVILFGPSIPSISGHSSNENIYLNTHCSPCIDILMDSKCPYDKMCLDKISVEDVVGRIKKILINK